MLKDYKVNVTKLCNYCMISRQYYYDLCNEKCEPTLYKAAMILIYLRDHCGYNVTFYDLFPSDMTAYL